MELLQKSMLGDFAPLDGSENFRVPEPVEATFRHVLNQLYGIGILENFSEEEITSALLGGFAAAYPLCLGIFTDTLDEQRRIAQQNRCSWGQYSKSRTGTPKDNETDRGADFALVIWTGEDRARVALFQAKRFEGARPRGPAKPSPVTAGANTPAPAIGGEGLLPMMEKGEHFIDVRRARVDEHGNIIGATQMVTLARTGKRIGVARALPTQEMQSYFKYAEVVDAPPFSFREQGKDETLDHYTTELEVARNLDERCREKASKAMCEHEMQFPGGSQGTFRSLDWIHYLGYARLTGAAKRKSGNGPVAFASGTVCVALSELSTQYAVERVASGLSTPIGDGATPGRRNLVDLATVNCFPLINVILNAFGPGDGDVPGWISLDAATIEAALPSLQQFGHVFMGTDKGGVGLALIQKLNRKARPAMTKHPAQAATPTAADASSMGKPRPGRTSRPS